MSDVKAKVFRSAELTPEAAEVVDRIKELTKIPIRHLIAEAVIRYLPARYERKASKGA